MRNFIIEDRQGRRWAAFAFAEDVSEAIRFFKGRSPKEVRAIGEDDKVYSLLDLLRARLGVQ